MRRRVVSQAGTALGISIAILLGAGIVEATLAGDGGGTSAPRVRSAGGDTRRAGLPVEEIVARLRADGYTDIREIERKHGRYDVAARDDKGERVELRVDARTGDVLERERED